MKVVNVKVAHIRPQYTNLKEWIEDPQNVYIGRGKIVFIEGVRYPPQDSIWANPYKITGEKRREDVIREYQAHLEEKFAQGKITLTDLENLQGKRLGCWCKPEPCHGDVLRAFVEEKLSEKSVTILDDKPHKV